MISSIYNGSDRILQQLILFLVLLVVCTIGAYAKDVIDQFMNKKEKIMLRVIMVSSLIVSFLLWAVAEPIYNRIGIKPFFAVTLLFGMVSYEITSKLTSIGGLFSLVKQFNEFRRAMGPLPPPDEKGDDSD